VRIDKLVRGMIADAKHEFTVAAQHAAVRGRHRLITHLHSAQVLATTLEFVVGAASLIGRNVNTAVGFLTCCLHRR